MINCEIPISGDTTGVEYYVTPTTDGDGDFHYNGTEYRSGKTIKVEPNTIFVIQYEPVNQNGGTHTISLIASDSFGQKASQQVVFTVYQPPAIEEGSFQTARWQDGGSSCFNGCDYLTFFAVKWKGIYDDTAEPDRYEMVIRDGRNNSYYSHTGKIADMVDFSEGYDYGSLSGNKLHFGPEYDGYLGFYTIHTEPSKIPNYDGQPFDFYIIDTKYIKRLVYQGNFTYSPTDAQ
ncbi:MAG: hypothetical protein ACK5MD_09635 [Flavobacteriales bacterium]